MWAVVKKEFKSYFLSPIGYVVIGALLFISSRLFLEFFYKNSVMYGEADLINFYYNFVFFGNLIAIPILTMRMFSEERKSGTEQLLLTTPISITKVVFGKLLAGLSVIGITLLCSLGYYVITSIFGKVSIIPVFTSILGFMLVSLAAMSVGMFTSSVTENQIISCIITFVVLLMNLFIANTNSFFSKFLIMNYYNKFPSGLISLTEVAGLLSFAMVFVSLTIIIMQRRKSVK